MKYRVFVLGLVCGMIASGSLVANYFAQRESLKRWFNGDSAVSLTNLKLSGRNSSVLVTNQAILRGIQLGLKTKRFSNAPYSYPCDAYVQLNRRWAGQISISFSGRNIVIGIPSTAYPLEHQFTYAEFDVDRDVVSVLEKEVGALRTKRVSSQDE